VVQKDRVLRSRRSIIAIETNIVRSVGDPPKVASTGVVNEVCSGRGHKGAENDEGGDLRAEHLLLSRA